jgi:hypothetical protein
MLGNTSVIRPALDQMFQGTDPLSHFDTLEKIVPWCEPSTIIALSCVSRSLKQDVSDCLSGEKAYETAFKICGSRLRVIDTGSAKMPAFVPFDLIKGCHTLLPLIEGDAGLTFLIMCEGLTLRELVTIAAKKGIIVSIPEDEMLEGAGDISIGRTYGALITNNVFKNSRNKNYEDQRELNSRARCEMPTVQDYVALCVFTQIAGEYLYGCNPLTYGRSSTYTYSGSYLCLVVGGSAPSRLHVDIGYFDDEYLGVGGLRPLPPPRPQRRFWC